MMLNSRYNAIHSKIKEANMKKRLLSLMMALLLVLTLVPAAAFAEKAKRMSSIPLSAAASGLTRAPAR